MLNVDGHSVLVAPSGVVRMSDHVLALVLVSMVARVSRRGGCNDMMSPSPPEWTDVIGSNDVRGDTD